MYAHMVTHFRKDLCSIVPVQKILQIYPFTDGNGRVARIIMNCILLNKGYPLFYIENRYKIRYYKALEAADKDDLKTYVKFIVNTIMRQFIFKWK